jgi:16S rRNA (guanine527-N7)-methyltransferase
MKASAPLDQVGCAELLDVSRETLAPCALLVDLLRRWQRAVNLVGRSTLADPWRRHILDSGQVVRHLPAAAGSVTDLGSGAGFPGLVVAILSGRRVDLVEADGRKAEFLREAGRKTGALVRVHHTRIESLQPAPAAVVTARALAPLDRLLSLAEPIVTRGTRCLFLKSAEVERELTAAVAHWHMEIRRHPSISDPRGVVLQLEDVHRAADPQA